MKDVGKTFTKAELNDSVFERIGFSKVQSRRLVDLLLTQLRELLIKGESVQISNFGSFNVLNKKKRRGRNPHTGDKLMIASRRSISFRSSQTLKEAIKKHNKA